MNLSSKGETVVTVTQRVEPVKLEELRRALGTSSAADTARLVLYFGPTIAGEKPLVECLGMDLSRALLAGQSYEWARPFEPDETVTVTVTIDDVFEKGDNTFGIVGTSITDSNDQVVQRQRTTFIERKQS